MSDWYHNIERQIQPIFAAICQHNFIRELAQGTLSQEVFEFYIRQDSLYLSVYKKLLATIAAKCNDVDECQFFLLSAVATTEVELELHKLYADPADPADASPSCELYNGFLSSTVLLQPLSVAMAAVLPCFTIYQAVGEYILSLPQQSNNPYQAWIDAYGGEDFAKSVEQAIAIVNRHAEISDEATKQKMNQAFIKAAKLEWMFWDSAYRQESWVV